MSTIAIDNARQSERTSAFKSNVKKRKQKAIKRKRYSLSLAKRKKKP